MIDIKQGDCLELMKEIPDGSVDTITDNIIMEDIFINCPKFDWYTLCPIDTEWESTVKDWDFCPIQKDKCDTKCFCYRKEYERFRIK